MKKITLTSLPKAIRFGSKGFTLVELLVVVGILILLTTMTVLAIDFTMNGEKVRSAARQIQSLLEGARDRAIHAGAPRGVRFLVENDPLNGRKCTSMIYIGSSDTWSRGTITLMRSDFDFNDTVDNTDRDGDGQADTEIYMIEGSPETLWFNLLQRGYLPVYEVDLNGNGQADPNEDLNGNGVLDQRTARIKIPGDRNGVWYNVSTYHLGKSTTRPNILEFIPLRPYRDPGSTATNQVVAFEGTGPVSYILELPSRVLADAEPVILPVDVAIDLDASAVPDAWRPQFGSPGVDPLQVPYSNQMDILFSPRGTVTGAEAASGLIHFYIGLRQDIDAVNSGVFQKGTPITPRTPVWAGSWNQNAVVPAENGSVNDPPVGDRALVTVFTQTGKVASFPINKASSGGAPYASAPYSYAAKAKGGAP